MWARVLVPLLLCAVVLGVAHAAPHPAAAPAHATRATLALEPAQTTVVMVNATIWAGETAVAEVQLRHGDGSAFTDETAATVDATVTSAAGFGPSSALLVDYVGAGLFEITFEAEMATTYTVSVRVNGVASVHTAALVVLADELSPAMSAVEVVQTPLRAAESGGWIVDLLDSEGLPLPYQNYIIKVEVEGSGALGSTALNATLLQGATTVSLSTDAATEPYLALTFAPGELTIDFSAVWAATYTMRLSVDGSDVPELASSVVVTSDNVLDLARTELTLAGVGFGAEPVPAVAGEPGSFTLQLTDRFGNAITTFDGAFDAEVSFGAQYTAQVVTGPVQGVVTCTFTFVIATTYPLVITIDGHTPLQFAYECVPGLVRVSDTVTSGSLLTSATLHPGAQYELVLEPRDALGNALITPVTVDAHASGPSVPVVDVLMQPWPLLFTVEFGAAVPGEYTLECTIEGTHVPGSPFALTLSGDEGVWNVTGEPALLVDADLPASLLAGDAVDGTIVLENSGTSDGWGPTVDVLLAGGALTHTACTLYDVELVSTTLSFATTGCQAHPYVVDPSGAAAQVCAEAGDVLVAMLLPDASLAAGQRETLQCSWRMDASVVAGVDVRVFVRAGYRFGRDPFDNPTDDFALFSLATVQAHAWGGATIGINVFKLNVVAARHVLAGCGSHTTTVSMDVSDGAELTDVRVNVTLPLEATFEGVGGVLNVDAPPLDEVVSEDNRMLVVHFASVELFASFSITYSIPAARADGSLILSPASDASVLAEWDLAASANYTPDGADAPVHQVAYDDWTVSINAVSAATSVVYTDGGDTLHSDLSPGDVLTWRVSVTPSAYHTFGAAVLHETLSDGHRLTRTDDWHVQVGGATVGSATTADGATVDTSDIGNDLDPATGGTTGIMFPVGAMLDTHGVAHGVFGQCTRVTVVYYTVVLHDYSDSPNGSPTLDMSLDQGDSVRSQAAWNGALRNETAPLVTIGAWSAGSAASATVPVGSVQIAVVGSTCPCTFVAGEHVSVELRYSLATTSFEDLALALTPPQPLLVEGLSTTLSTDVSATLPAPMQCKYGPDSTYVGPAPTMSLDTTLNSIIFTYADYDDADSDASEVHLFCTITVSTVPVPDLFSLVLVGKSDEHRTYGSYAAQTVKFAQPVFSASDMYKGIVRVDGAGSVQHSDFGNVAFSAVGSAGTRFNGTISAALLPFTSSLTCADAGDTFTTALIVPNIGSGEAFDVTLFDTFDDVCFEGAGNFRATDGTGAELTVTGSLFESGGLRVTAPLAGTATGGLTSGEGVLVVTYDASVRSDVQIGTECGTTLEMINFSSGSGGNNHVDALDTPPEIAYGVSVCEPAIAIALVDTLLPETAGAQLVVGETITYDVTVTLPEGRADDVTLDIALPSDAYVVESATITTVGARLFTTGLGVGASGVVTGNTVTFGLGTVTNAHDNVPTDADQMVVRLVLRLDDDASVAHGRTLTTTATLSNGVFPTASAQANAHVQEPALTVALDTNVQAVDGADLVVCDVTIAHTGASAGIAHDTVLTVTLPADVTFDAQASSPELNVLDATTLTLDAGDLADPTGATAQIVVTVADDFAIGSSLTFDAALVWQSAEDAVTGHRTYAAADDVTVTSHDAGATIAVVGSSLESTSGSDLAVGEEVTLDCTVVLPEGTFTSGAIVVSMPNGNRDLRVESTAIVTVGSSLDVTADDITTVVSNRNSDAFVDTATFTVGDFAVTADNLIDTTNRITVRTVASVVVEQAGNKNRRTAWPSCAFESTLAGASDNVRVRVVEPFVVVVNSYTASGEGDTIDASDTVSFSQWIGHNSALRSMTTAYSLTMQQTIPDTFAYVPGTLAVAGGVEGAEVAIDETNKIISLTVPSLALGQAVQVTYDTVVDAEVAAGLVVVDPVSVAWTSLPDAAGRAYSADHEVWLVVSGLGLTCKLVDSTSFDFTAAAAVTPFEVGTLTCEAVLPEGTVQDVQLVMELPGVMQVTGSRVVALGAQLEPEHELSEGTLSDSDGSGHFNAVIFTLGDVLNVADNAHNVNDSMVVEIDFVVLDAEAGGTALLAENTLWSSTTPVESDVLFTFVEPDLHVLSTLPSTVQPGEEVTVTLTLAHTGDSSSHAYGCVVTGEVPPFAVVSAPASAVGSVSMDGNAFEWTTGALEHGTVAHLTYTVTVPADECIGTTHHADTTATWHNTPAGPPQARTYVRDFAEPTVIVDGVSNSKRFEVEGYEYALLDNANPNAAGAGCQRNALALPGGWELAPNDATTRHALPCKNWATTCLVLASGVGYTPDLTPCGTDLLVTSDGATIKYAPAECPARIVIRRATHCHTEGVLANGDFADTRDGAVLSWNTFGTVAYRTDEGAVRCTLSGAEGESCGVYADVAPSAFVLRNGISVAMESSAEGVVSLATNSSTYAVFADVFYIDGSADFGVQDAFETGTHAAQTRAVSLHFHPDKTVSFARVYALFRDMEGTVYFDNVVTGPPTCNLVRNAALQVSTATSTPANVLTHWAALDEETGFTTEVDAERGAVVCVENAADDEVRGVQQSVFVVPVGQATSYADEDIYSVYVSADSRAEEVSGAAGRGYSVYADVLFRDGSADFGHIASFSTGTHAWETAHMQLTFAKPIARVQLVLQLQGHTGKACFDAPVVCPERGECMGTLPPAVSYGDPHMQTYDGLAYDLHLVGDFVYTRDEWMQVVTRHEVAGRATVNSGVSVELLQSGTTVAMERATARTMPTLWVNGAEVALTEGMHDVMAPDSEDLVGVLHVTAGVNSVVATVRLTEFAAGHTVTVQWLVSAFEVQYANVGVTLPAEAAGTAVGLMGNFDAEPSNDLVARDGTVVVPSIELEELYRTFGESWRVGDADHRGFAGASATPSAPDHFLGLSPDDFSDAERTTASAVCRAHGLALESVALQNCILDVLATGDTSFANTYDVVPVSVPAGTSGVLGPSVVSLAPLNTDDSGLSDSTLAGIVVGCLLAAMVLLFAGSRLVYVRMQNRGVASDSEVAKHDDPQRSERRASRVMELMSVRRTSVISLQDVGEEDDDVFV